MFKKRKKDKGSGKAQVTARQSELKKRTPISFEEEDEEDPLQFEQSLKEKTAKTRKQHRVIPKTRVTPAFQAEKVSEVATKPINSTTTYSKENLERLRQLSIRHAPKPETEQEDILKVGQVLTDDLIPSETEEEPSNSVGRESEESYIPLPGKKQKKQTRFADVLKQDKHDYSQYADTHGSMDLTDEAWEDEQVERGVGHTHAHHPMTLPGVSHSTPHVAGFTYESVMGELNANLEEIGSRHHIHERQVVQLDANLELLKTEAEKEKNTLVEIDSQYQFMQEMRSFIIALENCLAKKEGMIVKVEDAVVRHRERLANARADRRMQRIADYVVLAESRQELGSRGDGGLIPKSFLGDVEANEEKDEFGRSKSFNARSGRMQRVNDHVRRRAVADSWENMDESDSESKAFETRIANVRKACDMVFADVDESFSSSSSVLKRYGTWKQRYPIEYEKAFGSLSLPALLRVFYRHKFLLWDPLAENSSQFLSQFMAEVTSSAESLGSAEQESLKDELLLMIVFPLISESIRSCWDPYRIQESKAIAALLQNLEASVKNDQKKQKYLSAVLDTIREKMIACERETIVPVPHQGIVVSDQTLQFCEDQLNLAILFFQSTGCFRGMALMEETVLQNLLQKVSRALRWFEEYKRDVKPWKQTIQEVCNALGIQGREDIAP